MCVCVISNSCVGVDERGLKEGFTAATSRVQKTREQTLVEFNIDLNSMTSTNANTDSPDKINKKPSLVKQLASVYDK